MPALSSLLLVHCLFQASPLNFAAAHDDEIEYWHQIGTFARSGFHGGLYGFEELPALASSVRYGAHGPGFAVLYGSIAKLTGWGDPHGYIINLVLITAAFAAYLLGTRPSLPRAAACSAALALFAPLQLELPSVMQETVNAAIAMIASLALICLLRREKRIRWFWAPALMIGVFLAGVLRPYWFALCPALLLAAYRPQKIRGIFIVGLISAGLALILFLLMAVLVTPYPSMIYSCRHCGIREDGWRMLHLARDNLRNFWILPFSAAGTAENFAALVRVHLLLLLVPCAAVVLMDGRKRWLQKRPAEEWPTIWTDPAIHVLLIVGGWLLAVMCSYTVSQNQGQRILQGMVVLGILVLTPTRRAWIALLQIAPLLLTLPIAMSEMVRERDPNFHWDRASRDALREQIARALPGNLPSDEWEKTILIDVRSLWRSGSIVSLTAIPFGYGLNFYCFRDRLKPPIHSRYLLFDAEALESLRERTGGAGGLNLQALVATPCGTLYRQVMLEDGWPVESDDAF